MFYKTSLISRNFATFCIFIRPYVYSNVVLDKDAICEAVSPCEPKEHFCINTLNQ